MTTERVRYAGGDAAFLQMLRSVATNKSFIRYTEVEKVEDARLDVEAVSQAHDVLSAMHGLQSNLCFPKKMVESAVDKLFEEKASSWNLKAEHKADWVTTITRRIRNIGRVVGQGEGKTPTAPCLGTRAATRALRAASCRSISSGGTRRCSGPFGPRLQAARRRS